LRSEFFGDELESLREFEVESQGSVGDIANARILPAAEIMLTPEAVAGADGPLRQIDFTRTLPEVRDQWLTDIERVRSGAYFDGIEGFQAYLDPSQPTLFDHLPQDALILSLDGRRSLTQAEQREQELQELVAVEIERGELPHGLRPGLVSIASLRQAAGGWRRLEVARVRGKQPVAQGCRVPAQRLEVYGGSDLCGGLRQRVRRGVVRARSATWELEFEPGDVIVHVDHGSGRFSGMRLMGDEGQEREYMQ